MPADAHLLHERDRSEGDDRDNSRQDRLLCWATGHAYTFLSQSMLSLLTLSHSTQDSETRSVCSYFEGPDGAYLQCNNALTWDAARIECAALGGHLAIISSAVEDNLLTASDARAWIGLNDIDVEGTFAWEDGSPVVYEDFHAPFQPDDSRGDEDCGEIKHNSSTIPAVRTPMATRSTSAR